MNRYKILEITKGIKAIIFEETSVSSDIYSMFSSFSKEDININLLNEEDNTDIEVGFNYFMLITDDRKILVDTGRGTGELIDSMSAAGIEIDDVTDLIITHADGDHVGGIGSFPNSRIHISNNSYKLWSTSEGIDFMNEEFRRAMGTFMPVARLEGAIKKRNQWSAWLKENIYRISLIEEKDTFLDFFQFFHTPAHRSDHYSIEINLTDDKHVIIAADAIRLKAQLDHPRFYSQFESNPELMESSVEAIKKRIKQPSLIFGNHVSWPSYFYYG